MKPSFWTPEKKRVAIAFAVVTFGLLLYFSLKNLSVLKRGLNTVLDILFPFLFGAVVAYLLDPICDKLYAFFLRQFGKTKMTAKRTKSLANGLSIALSLLFLLALVVLIIALIISQLVPTVTALVAAIPGYVSDIYDFVLPLVSGTEVEEWLVELDLMTGLKNWATGTLLPNMDTILTTVTSGVSGVVSVFYNVLIGFIVSFYCLNYRAKFALQGKKALFALFPFRWAEAILERLRFANKAFSGFISGKIIDSLIIGVICFVGCMVLRIPYYPLVAVIVGVTNIIPFFGPFIGAIPSALLILMEDPIKCLTFIIFVILLQQFDGNILGPRILSSSVGVSGFWVLFSILFFGGVWGVIGMVVGTPLFAVVYSIIRDWMDSRLKAKALPREAWHYDDLDAFEEAHRPKE